MSIRPMADAVPGERASGAGTRIWKDQGNTLTATWLGP